MGQTICGISTDLEGNELRKILTDKARVYRMIARNKQEDAECIEKYLKTMIENRIECPKCKGEVKFNVYDMPRCVECRTWYTIKLVEDEYQTDIKEEQLDV